MKQLNNKATELYYCNCVMGTVDTTINIKHQLTLIYYFIAGLSVTRSLRMYLKEISVSTRNWIDSTKDGDWRGLAIAVIDLRVS